MREFMIELKWFFVSNRILSILCFILYCAGCFLGYFFAGYGGAIFLAILFATFWVVLIKIMYELQ